MKILIVEDDINSRVLLERELLSQGYTVESAANGVRALERVNLSPPELIISDILMPGMDGFELCRRIKTDGRLQAIPFVFYTATYTDKKDEDLAMSLGASRFLIKPMEPEAFLNEIKEVIEEYSAGTLLVSDHLLQDMNELDRMQVEALARKLDKKVRELSEQREALQRAQRDWENIFQAIGHPTMILDAQHNILSVNKATVKAIGAGSAKELIGKKCHKIFHNADESAQCCPLVELLASREHGDLEREVEALGGIYLVSCTPVFDGKGNLEKIIHIATDITKRKRAEEELNKLAGELRRSNNDLQQFAYAASHDLQEPLRGIAGFAGLLEKRYKGKLDKEAEEFIDFIITDAKRMQELIKDLLAYSQLEKNIDISSNANCSVILEEALNNLRLAMEETGAQITYDLLPTLTVDASQMKRLFQNLIGNAIKFRGEGKPRIHVSAKRGKDEWVFSVQDNGIGIEPQFLERIFVFFQRLHPRQEYEGTGMGLAMCKRIVEQHGGRIWVESMPGRGSTFYFTIPVVS